MYVQDRAKELSLLIDDKNLKSIASFGCLAFVYLWCMGVEGDDLEQIMLVYRAMKAGVIDKDCTVYAEQFIKTMSGRDVSVLKKPVHDITLIKDRTPVLYSINGTSGHWVGVENGEIKFNTLKNSKCVAEGKPISSRVIILK